MERLCLDCGSALKGRSDKKFCDDQCRSNYHNRLKSQDDSFMRQVNSILKKNRNVLEKFNPEGKNKIGRNKLINAGFNFSYFTNLYETQKGSTYYFCYEYGYLLLEKDEILLVKREES